MIDADGRLDLGDQARAAGYRPGTVVDVVITSTGTLFVVPADEPVIDLQPVKPLPSRRQAALSAGSGR
ncbi:MAG: hypothetical protein IT306_14710 [Chloroflexi bacterium]|nr:hypothetical protein [Chloroflexota bacterium]